MSESTSSPIAQYNGNTKIFDCKKNNSSSTTRGSIQVINTMLQVNSPCESKLIVFHRDYSQNLSYRRSPLSSRYIVGFYTDIIVLGKKKKPYYNVPTFYILCIVLYCYYKVNYYRNNIYKIISSNC